MNTKELLDRYKEKIVIIKKDDTYVDKNGDQRVKAKWKENRNNFLYKGEYSEDIVLWETPRDVVPIEFEGTREENEKWIRLTAEYCKSKGIEYCIGDHCGKSEYLWIFNITGISEEREQNHKEKKLLVTSLIPKGANVDWSNLGIGLTPVIGHQHWKEKYNGNIHKITSGISPLEQKNEYPKELLFKPINEEIKTINLSRDNSRSGIESTASAHH